MVGQKKIGRQDLGALALSVALDELYGLGYAHIDAEDALYEAVTLDQVKAVSKKYLKPETSVIAVVKPGISNQARIASRGNVARKGLAPCWFREASPERVGTLSPKADP